MSFLFDFLANPILSACFLGWLAAQGVKSAHAALRGNWSLREMIELGGMPSSHAALVVSLSFAILLFEGVTSAFVISLIVALVVMRDAMGVRHEVGEHAKIINKMNHYAKLSVRQGHTTTQVLVGAIIGLIAAAIAIRAPISIFYLIQVLYFMLPAIAANAMPILAKRIHPGWNAPIDGSKKWRGRRIFGENKTWRGLVFGVFSAIIIVIFQGWLRQFQPFTSLSLYSYGHNLLLVGALIGIGVLGADLIKSFFKRRLRIAAGGSFFPFDQIDAVIGGLIVIVGFRFYDPSAGMLMVIVFLALILHLVFNGLKHDLKWA